MSKATDQILLGCMSDLGLGDFARAAAAAARASASTPHSSFSLFPIWHFRLPFSNGIILLPFCHTVDRLT